MVGKVFLLMCALVFLNQVSPSPLTKEITADKSPELKFRNILAEFERSNVFGETFNLILDNFNEVYSNLADLIQSKAPLEISEVVDIFNYGFGERLLVVDKDSIQANPNAFERFLSVKTRSAIKDIYPKDYLKQLFVYSSLQKQIQNSVEVVRPKIENRKISIDKISARIASDSPSTETRATDLISALQSAVCETLINTAYSQLNDTLIIATTFLDTITISSSDNGLISLAASVVSFGVEVSKQGLTLVWDLAQSFQSSICSTLLSSSSSRKRRDLTFVEEFVERSNRDTALVEAKAQDLSIRSITVITTVLWSILSAILSYALTYLINQAILALVSFLINVVGEWLYSIIDSIF